ncbi:MAG: hypothetical protein IPM23_00290 [Candidatus Melainabacteria bacterium]|nr:hypothetical protein [Candidatus Melainabacteria bacterium]
MSLSVSAARVEIPAQNKPASSRLEKAAPFLIFILAFLMAGSVSFTRFSLGSAGLFDSGHYVESSAAVQAAFADLMKDPSRLVSQCRAVKDAIMLDGPVMPLLGSAAYSLVGARPDITHMQPVIFLMILVHGLTAVLVYAVCRRMTASLPLGILGGLLWALYPSALVSTSKFLTEPLTCLVEVGALYLASLVLQERSKGIACYLGLGLLLSVAVLLKPLVAPGMLLMAFLPFLSERRSLGLKLAAFVLGVAILFAPWLAFTGTATGKVYLSPQRQPIYNLFRGFDLATDGRDCPDPPEQIDALTLPEALGTIKGRVLEHPDVYAAMAFRKFERLWYVPWNDYRFAIAGLPLITQSIWHTFLLTFGCLGTVSFFLRSKGVGLDPKSRLICLSSLALIAAHAPYMAFSAIPRYGFTAVPLFCILAVYFFWSASQSRKVWSLALGSVGIAIAFTIFLPLDIDVSLTCFGMQPGLALSLVVLLKALLIYLMVSVALGSVKGARRLGLASAILALPFLFSAGLLNDGEYSLEIPAGNRLVRLTEIPPGNPDRAVILIDSAEALPGSTVSLNGRTVEEPSLPLYRYSQTGTTMRSYQLFSGVLGTDADRFRQWQALSVPVSWLVPGGKNTIAISPGQKNIRIYGSVAGADGKYAIPSLFDFSFTKMSTDMADFDARIPYLPVSAERQSARLESRTGVSQALPGYVRVVLLTGFEKARPEASALPSDPVAMIDKPLVVAPGAPAYLVGSRQIDGKDSGSCAVRLSGVVKGQQDSPATVSIDLVMRRLDRPDFSVNAATKKLEVEVPAGGLVSIKLDRVVPFSALGTEFRPEVALGARRGAVILESLECSFEHVDSADFRYLDWSLY